MRIGIVMLSAIGDAVHVLPIVNALKRHDSANNITWLLQSATAALVRGHPAIDTIVEIDPRRSLAPARALEPFDLLIDLQVALKAGIVTAVTRARTKLGFDRARARDLNWLFTTKKIPAHPGRQHVQDQYFEFLTALGVPIEPVVWNLGPWPSDPPPPAGRYAALAIGASDPGREWLPDRWAAVADALEAVYGLRPIIVGAGTARDRAAAAAIKTLARGRVEDALGSGLRPLVSILAGAQLVISVDTGAVHMAVALDRPVITLMSNADPRRTGPYAKFHDLTVDAFHDPGEVAPISWTRRTGRMPRIAVSDVLDRLATWQAVYRRPRGAADSDPGR
jgi:heptosyltransferase I